MRDCPKVAVGEGQYIRFWWRMSSIPLSNHYSKGFFVSHEDLMSPWRDLMFFSIWEDVRIEIIRSVPKNRSDQIRSVAQSCPTLCNPMNHSTPGFPVHHQLPEFTQTHVHRVSDAISHLILCRPLLLLPPTPPSIRVFSNESWGGQSIGVSALASVLPMNTQDWFPLGWTGWIFLQSKGLSRVFSNTTVQKHQFFSSQLSSQSNSHIHTWPLEKP